MGVALVMFAYLVVGLFALTSLGMTWGDAKGGASGNLPPVLTISERMIRSVLPMIVLGLMLGSIYRWWKRQRTT